MKARALIGSGHLVGVEAQHQPDGTWRFAWVHLRKRKTGVMVERQGSDVADVRTLTRTVGARYPVALVISGERVLVRDAPNPFDASRDLGKVLPNARPEDLVICSLARTEHTEVGIVRAQVVVDLLNDLHRSGARAICVFVGGSVGRAIEGLTENGTGTPGGSPARLGTETVERSCLLAFAAAWQHWFHPLELTTSPLSQVDRARSEEQYRRLYEIGSIAIAALLVILLAGDLWLRDRLDARQTRLQGALEQQRHDRAELDSLTEAVRIRKDLIAAAGIGQAGGTMRLLDQVSASVPANVVLQEVWFAPATKPLMEGESMQREKKRILIHGHAPDPAVLPVWVSSLSKINGVRNARLESMERDPNEGTPAFRILVDLS